LNSGTTAEKLAKTIRGLLFWPHPEINQTLTCKFPANLLPWMPSLRTACSLPSDQESLCIFASRNMPF